MSTRSRIGILQPDGSVLAIYCHFDGYPDGVGSVLKAFYSKKEKVQELIALGSISSLGENIGTKHDFNNPPSDECNVYGRDREEEDTAAEHFAGEVKYGMDTVGEYNYLFKNNKWYLWRDEQEKFTPLTDKEVSQ